MFPNKHQHSRQKCTLCCAAVAMEKMDAMLSDVNAWQSQYADVGDDIDDELKVPQCGESFVTLVSAMTGQCDAAAVQPLTTGDSDTAALNG